MAAAARRVGDLHAVIDTSRRTVPPGDDPDLAAAALAAAYTDWDALCRAAARLPRPPAVVLATEAAFAVTGQEPSIAHAALPGLAQSLAQSHPTVPLVLVDGASDDALAAEHGGVPGQAQVAWRDGRRRVLRLRPVPAGEIPAVPSRVLVPGGHYLVIGGLGGVGALLCRHLLRRFDARLLVVGRTSLHPGGERAQTLAYLADHAGAGPAEIRYQALDATDAGALRAAVEAAERRAGRPLDAVFNLLGEGSVVEQVDALMSADLADLADPTARARAEHRAAARIRACHSLDLALSGRDVPRVTFGSVNGFFGGAGFAHYSGACSYQAARALRLGRPEICLEWSMWQQVGMAAGTPRTLTELAERRGFARLTAAQGLASLHVALDVDQPRVLIGLLPDGEAVAPLLPPECFGWTVEARGIGESAEVADLLGVSVAQVRCVSGGTVTPGVTSGSRHQRTLLEVFRGVLAAPELSAEDNFFGAGGDSIRAIQAVTRAAERGIRFTALDLFEHKSVAALVAHLAAGDRGPDPPEEFGAGSGPVPLPPIFRWWLETADRPQLRNRLTMSMRYEIDHRLAPERVGAALTALVTQHEALRLRLVDTADGPQLEAVDDAAAGLVYEVVDLAADGDEERAVADLERRLHAGLDLAAGPVVRSALVRFAGRPRALLVLAVHHAMVDGVSWRIIEDDLVLLLGSDPDAALPARTAGYLDWARRVAHRARQVDGRALADTWLGRLDLPSVALPGSAGSGRPLERDSRVLTRKVPDAVPRDGGTSVNEVLLSAVAWNLREWTGADAVVLDVEGHGRLERDLPVDLSRSVGWFTVIAPLGVDLTGCGSVADVVPRVHRAVADVRGRELEWGMVRYLGICPPGHPLQDLPEREVSFNYLGVFDAGGEPNPSLTAVPGSLGAEQAPDAARRYLIDVAAQVNGGDLELAVKFSPEIHAAQDVERWLDGCAATVRALLAGAAGSVLLTDLDPDDLRLALEEVGFE